MSHALGAVRFDSDGLVMFYEYEGTSDVCISHLYPTAEEMSNNWRKGTWLNCNCGRGEPVTVYTSYGFGSEWRGKCCRYCLAFTEGKESSLDSKDYCEGEFPEWMNPNNIEACAKEVHTELEHLQ